MGGVTPQVTPPIFIRMHCIEARAPTRIDLGGGWTDVPPYSVEQGGFVCNIAIGRYARVRLTEQVDQAKPSVVVDKGSDARLVQQALRRANVTDALVALQCDFPVGAGLGGSSAASIAALGALSIWNGAPIDRAALAEQSRDLEVADLGIAGGRQDHYAAAFGGALALTFGECTTVKSIVLSAEVRRALEERCVVSYTGQSRISGDTITAVVDAYRSGNTAVAQSLAEMKRLATLMAAALAEGSIDEVARLVGEHWKWQRSLHPSIPTPLIDALLDRARRAGALGGKALGASGGGCVLAIAAEGRGDDVRNAMSGLSALLPVQVDEKGFLWEAA